MSKEEYDKYIQAGVSLRRNTYRGKDITDYYTGDKTINDRDLFQQISNCTFDDIYVGDYVTTSNGGNNITWLIADLNNYLHSGLTITVDKCHATIIPSNNLESQVQMNNTDTTGVVNHNLKLTTTDNGQRTDIGAYMGSNMKQVILPKMLETYVEPVFENHIIEYSTLLSDSMNPELINASGQNTGASSRYSWYKSKIDLMSEVNVFGTAISSSSYFDIGIDNRQYALFQLKPELTHQTVTGGRIFYWLKDVVSATSFSYVTGRGGVDILDGASTTSGVRPRFLID